MMHRSGSIDGSGAGIAPGPGRRLAGMTAPHCCGLTLIELLVVLGIAAVTTSVAAPNLHDLVRAQQLRTASGELHGAIQLARAQAIARNERVTMTPNDPFGRDWSRGWTVFVDRNDDRRPNDGDQIVAVRPPLPAGLQVDYSFTSPALPQYIAYNGAGRSCSATNSAVSRLGTLSLFHGGGIRRITINMLGRARLCNPARERGCDGAATPS
jgi:type IV fimbrial biogenesis protein FimT